MSNYNVGINENKHNVCIPLAFVLGLEMYIVMLIFTFGIFKVISTT